MRIVNLDGELYECDDYRDRLLPFVPDLLAIIKCNPEIEMSAFTEIEMSYSN